jgi:hypothetical protein
MPAPVLSWLDHQELRSASWLAKADSTPSAVLLRYLLAFLAGGIAAVCVAFIEFNLRMPGNAILKGTLPVALGLAIAPQRLSGLVISGGALTGLIILKKVFGLTSGMGATASLLALGPMLDTFLWNARRNGWLYLRFAAAGLAANCTAFANRGGNKAAGFDNITMRPLQDWLTVAPLTYAAFGLAAGLISSLILFRLGRSRDTSSSPPAQP